MKTIRTIPPVDYISPSQNEKQEMAKNLCLKKYSPSLVDDLCNLISGGDMTTPQQIRDHTEPEIDNNLECPNDRDYKYRGKWLRDDGDYVSDQSLARRIALEKEVEYHTKVQEFLQALNLEQLPGNSPLEKAMGLLKVLASKEGQEGGYESEEQGMPIFGEDKPKKLADELNQAFEDA